MAGRLTYTEAAWGARPDATGVAVERSALGAVTNTSTAPAPGLMFTTRSRVCPDGIDVDIVSLVTNEVTVPPPVPPTAYTVRSSFATIVSANVATVTLVSAVFFRTSV